MTATDISNRLSNRLSIPRTDARRILRAVLSAIATEALVSTRLEFRGLGTFQAVRRPAHPGYNFRTGSLILVSDRLALTFKAGRPLESKVHRARIRMPAA